MKYNFDEEIAFRGTGSIKWDAEGDADVIAMGCANMDFRTAPNITAALTEAAADGIFSYHFKSEAYYQAIIGWYDRKYRCRVEKDWLCNMPGVFPAIRMCLYAYTKPGDKVIVQTPHFGPINTVVGHAGCPLVLNPMILKNGRYEIDFADFEAKIKAEHPKAFLLINPHNPTGRVFTAEELARLDSICRENGVLVISDEVHGNILPGGGEHIPFFALGDAAANNSVVVTAPSKGYNLMDLTYSFLVIPNADLRRQFQTAATGFNFNFATNLFSIVGVTAALDRQADRWLCELDDYIKENHRYLEKRLSETDKIEVIAAEGGYMVWLDCRKMGKTPAQLKTFFTEQAKVTFSWGEDFGVAGEGFERMNIGCTRKTLAQALDRILAALEMEAAK